MARKVGVGEFDREEEREEVSLSPTVGSLCDVEPFGKNFASVARTALADVMLVDRLWLCGLRNIVSL